MDKFPNWADHIVAFVFCILIPLQGVKQNWKNDSTVVYNSQQKLAIYFSICFSLFIMAAIIIAVWLVFRRPLAELGLTVRIEGRLWIWTAMAFVIIYAIDTVNSVATPEKIAASISDWQKRTPFLPTIRTELPGYLFMCVCAGIFEEIVYRGYLVTYFDHLLKGSGYRQGLSVLLPALFFSISHFYQGVKAILKIFILSAFLGFIFIQSGSLVIVMLLHFVMNGIGGLLSIKYVSEK